ncbi:ash family protein [Edwardsiella ictaluri]|uniref:Rha family transcriptional regulator n=2 Tax=Edwardsiella ictaluri TaxID=67780 RepID=A0ABY8GG26_EDWIC|nr:Rha family phage regulatory protein [Edwardsiella ictaluri]ELV7528720.1 ash family protein [Edwardsiella ictaluri]KMQ77401.1 peptidase [Edwardsiella ictaluri]WFN96479.1 Rha family transcriptional regulator [Edwardsiella ictaluri]
MSSVDCLSSGGYAEKAAAKSVAGIGVPEFSTAHDRALAVFLCAMHGYIQIMVGRAGASKDAPVSVEAGYANPVRFTTSQIGVCGGDCPNHSTEAAIMATFPVPDHPEITVINGQVVTSSVAIADYFLKRHDDVLKKIRTLECSPGFHARNFAVCRKNSALQNGKPQPYYQITRDGFAFLAMGFTGKRAARFKEAYITAFSQMERALNGAPALPGPAHNAHAVYLYMTEIHRVWMSHLRPMLVASQSPLAHSLHDYINDGLFASALVDRSLNSNKEVCHE